MLDQLFQKSRTQMVLGQPVDPELHELPPPC
jgi:hypothetical protein